MWMGNQVLRFIPVMAAITDYTGNIARANEPRQPVRNEFFVRHDVNVICELRESRGVFREPTRLEHRGRVFRGTNSRQRGENVIVPLQKYFTIRPPHLSGRRAVFDESMYVCAHYHSVSQAMKFQNVVTLRFRTRQSRLFAHRRSMNIQRTYRAARSSDLTTLANNCRKGICGGKGNG